ncbi:MAG: histidine phosphatase family protein [Sporolactobacillus sp.]
MKALYFIRHGQTLFNVLNKVQGSSDSLLTEEGASAAGKLGERFKSQNLAFDIAYTSDLGRARQTARLFLEHSNHPQTPLIETADLREVSFGCFEGGSNDRLWADVSKYSQNQVSESSTDEEKIQILSIIKKLDTMNMAENYEDVAKRIRSILNTARQSDAENLLFFSHGLFINCLLYFLTDQKMKVNHINNTTVTKITDDGQTFHIDYIGKKEAF